MISRVLVIAEHDGRELNASLARVVRCAQSLLPEQLTVLVLAADGAAVAEQAGRLDGVTRVVLVDNPVNAAALAEILAPQVVALVGNHTHVLAPASTFGRDLLPRVAALLGVSQVSDVVAVESDRRFCRPVYAGSILETVELDDSGVVVATVRSTAFDAVKPSATPAPTEALTLALELPGYTRLVETRNAKQGGPDLQSARRVVAGGRGVGSAENFALLQRLADRLGAAIGASRAAVDAGYVSNQVQVGQTGKIIAPELYFAVGISGAIQHLAGIKDARTIVAINKDSEASIFDVADIGLVGDLFDVLPEIERQLGQAGAGP
jgi:electron transfer flavoprotein alpha subunit